MKQMQEIYRKAGDQAVDVTHPFYRDTWAEIDLNAVHDNVTAIKASLPVHTDMMAVVKANAYGHGAVDVAREAVDAGATYLGVAILDEAIALRKAGISAPILVLGYIRAEDILIASELDIAVTVFQKEWLQKAESLLHAAGRKAVCHVKLDSGMGRIGLRKEEEIRELADLLKASLHIHVEGAYTHMAAADEPGNDYYHVQKGRFLDMMDWLESSLGEKVKIRHCANSASALRFHEESCNLVRVGISMYGMAPSVEMKPDMKVPLKQAMSLKSRITQVKLLEPGEGISYGSTYRTSGHEWIGTVPIGYADGWIRAHQSGDVLVKGKRAKIVGRICMDQMMILLDGPVETGTEVTLIGKDGGDFLSMDEVAGRIDTISYEIPCTLSYRVPRAVRKDGRVLYVHNDIF